tara:strand:- start:331 stop:513 length:183 start_codon:yes stop_codon:yes gene_type:complete
MKSKLAAAIALLALPACTTVEMISPDGTVTKTTSIDNQTAQTVAGAVTALAASRAINQDK